MIFMLKFYLIFVQYKKAGHKGKFFSFTSYFQSISQQFSLIIIQLRISVNIMKLSDLHNHCNKLESQNLIKNQTVGQIRYKQYMEIRTGMNNNQRIKGLHNSPKHERHKDITIEYLSKQNKALLSKVVKHQQQQDKYKRQIKKLQRSKSQTIFPQSTKIIPKLLKPSQNKQFNQLVNIIDYQQFFNISNRKQSFRREIKNNKIQLSNHTLRNQQTYEQSFEISSSQRQSNVFSCKSQLKDSIIMTKKDKQSLSHQIQRQNDKLLRLIEYPTGNMNKQSKRLHRLQINQCVLKLKRMKKWFQDLQKWKL